MKFSKTFLISTLWLSQTTHAALLKEVDCHKAHEAAHFGFTSFEEALPAIPKLFEAAVREKGLKVTDVLPKEVQADLANKLGPYYEAWASTILINPWTLEDYTGKEDSQAFLLLMKEGNLLEGRLPVELPKKDGTYLNFIRFTEPVTKAVTLLNLTHTYKTGKAGDDFTLQTTETIMLGEIEANKGKYVEVKVELAKEADHLKAIHGSLASSLLYVARSITEDKSVSKKAGQFALDVCSKIEKPSEALKFALDELTTAVK